MAVRDRTATQMTYESATPVVGILDERDLAGAQTIDLRGGHKNGARGWQRMKRSIARFLNDEMHLEQSPELVQDVADAHRYISETVLPAFQEARITLEAQGRDVVVNDCGSCALLRVSYRGRMEATVAARTRLTPAGVLPVFETRGRDGGRVRSALAAAQFGGLVVMPVYADDLRQAHVTRYVRAAHNAVRLA